MRRNLSPSCWLSVEKRALIGLLWSYLFGSSLFIGCVGFNMCVWRVDQRVPFIFNRLPIVVMRCFCTKFCIQQLIPKLTFRIWSWIINKGKASNNEGIVERTSGCLGRESIF